MKSVRLLLLLLMIKTPFLAAQPLAETMQIGAPEGHYMLPLGESLIQALYQPLNIKTELIPLPPLRSLSMVNSGELDAEMVRIAEVGQRYPDLIRLPTPLLTLQLEIVSATPNMTLDNLKQARKGRIVIQLNSMKSQQLIGHLEPVIVHSIEQQLKLLASGRVDFALIDSIHGLDLTTGYSTAERPLFQTTVLQEPGYHFLNKKHQALLLPLEQSAQDIQVSGRVEELLQQFRQQLLQRELAVSATQP